MRIQNISLFNTNFTQNQNPKSVENKKQGYSNYALGALGICAIGFGAVMLYNKKTSTIQNITEKTISKAETRLPSSW